MNEIFAFRLEKGADIKKSIEGFCINNNIDSACIVSCVGCVYTYNIRLADGKSALQKNDNMEIVSLTGTIAKGSSHLHISLSDFEGKVIGGHLLYDTIVNTTLEVVLMKINNYQFDREYDENTGYDELVIKESGES